MGWLTSTIRRSSETLRGAAVVAVLCLVVTATAGALSWDTGAPGTFEETPANTDAAREGAERIRELKLEIRDRAEAELCWGAGTSSGCGAADSGRLRLGAARIFVGTSRPSTLNGTDRLGFNALDSGRCFLDTDGATGNDWDDYTFECLDNNLVWRTIAIGGSRLLTSTSGATNGDILRFDGTKWVSQGLAQGDISTANVTSPAALAATPTAINLGTNPSVTVPNDGGAYNIHVQVNGSLCSDANSQDFGIELVQDPDGTPSVVATLMGTTHADTAFPFSMHYVIEGATNNTTYTFGLRGAATAADNIFIPANATNCTNLNSGLVSGTPNLRVTVTLSPRWGIR